jgi:hypothetical protein
MSKEIKQEKGVDESTKISRLENDVNQLRAIVQDQADQIAKQQKLLQLIQFSWLTFFFVIFNIILLVAFLALYMKDKGEAC